MAENMFVQPEAILRRFTIREGVRLVDLGSGVGHFTIPAARMVGPTGRVYAVDVRKETLERLVTAAKEEDIEYIDIMQGDIETLGGTGIRDDWAHIVILANTLFQAEDRASVLAESYRILRPGGRLLLVEWSGSFGGIGPREEHVVSEDTAERLCEHAGLYWHDSIEAGKYHYAYVYRKPEA